MLMQKESNIFSQDFSEEVSLLTQSKSEENNEQATQAQTNNNGKIDIIDSHIDTFCESSYKLGDIITSDLESIDKTKQKLMDNLNKTKAQLKEYMKIHEEQKNNIIQWQMEEEELSLVYQKEIDNRQELLDNTNYALDVTQILYEKHKSMTQCINNMVEISYSDEIVSEKQYQLANQLVDKVNKKQNDYEKEMCLLQERFDSLEKEIKENDNTTVIKVNTKTIEVQALKDKISNMEQMIFLEKKKLDQNLEETKGLNFEIESVKQNKCELSNKLKEIQKKKVDLITNINSKINSEKNELTKLTFTYKKNEKHLTNLETELKHVQTNVKRIQLSIEETVQQEINDKKKIKMNRDKLEELYTKQTKLQKDIINHEQLQSEIANLKLIIADKKIKNTNLTDVNESYIRNAFATERKLTELKKELEDENNKICTLKEENRHYKKVEEDLMNKINENKQKNLDVQKTTEETINLYKHKIAELKIKKDYLEGRCRDVKKECESFSSKIENLKITLSVKNQELRDLGLKDNELSRMIYENYLIHKSMEEDAEQKLKDLECDQEELFEEINPNLKEEITEIKMKIRENGMMFLVEKKAEMENFESQMQELGKEKLFYQEYIDDISKQEEIMRVKLENMNESINIKKELSMQLEMKLQKFNTRIVYIKNKEEEFKKKIDQLERKIRKVSAMARMSKNEIKEVITPKKRLSCFKKQGQIKLMTPSSSISLDDTEKKTTLSTPPHKIFKKKINLNKHTSIFDFDGH